jgi:hypothetical protein
MDELMQTDRSLLRHIVATLAYRGGKATRDVPQGFSEFRIGPSSRTPGQILAHIGDLLDWAYWLARGEHVWKESPPQTWEADVERFHAGLVGLDQYLASDAPLGFSAEQIFQGPIADAFTHIGQIAMLRRLASGPVKAENYFKAEIVVGRVGREQAKAVTEF